MFKNYSRYIIWRLDYLGVLEVGFTLKNISLPEKLNYFKFFLK